VEEFNFKKSKHYLERNLGDIHVRECLLSFGAEPLFPSTLFKNIKIKIYKTIIFLVVMYGCETWSLILRNERSLRMFNNRVLMRIFGCKRDEVKGECRILHHEELSDLYCSPNIVRVTNSRRMRWTGHITRIGEKRDV